MTRPFVSFCIPVHNSEKYLEATLQSVAQQTYRSYEIVCVNDHSTDQSNVILKRFSDRIKIFQAPRKGAAAARNTAFGECKGDLIVFLDSDDIISPSYLASQVQTAVANPNSVVVCKWGRFHNSIDTFKENWFLRKSDLSFYDWICTYWTINQHMTSPGRLIVPRSLIDAAGLWDESLSLNDDFDFFVRVFGKAKSICYNDDAVFYYRSGVGGLSSKTKDYHYQVSNLKSLQSGVQTALSQFPKDILVERACANILQQFIYENYPNNPDLVQQATNTVSILGGSNLKYDFGRKTNLMAKVFGWKQVKRFKQFIDR